MSKKKNLSRIVDNGAERGEMASIGKEKMINQNDYLRLRRKQEKCSPKNGDDLSKCFPKIKKSCWGGECGRGGFDRRVA